MGHGGCMRKRAILTVPVGTGAAEKEPSGAARRADVLVMGFIRAAVRASVPTSRVRSLACGATAGLTHLPQTFPPEPSSLQTLLETPGSLLRDLTPGEATAVTKVGRQRTEACCAPSRWAWL